MGSVRFNLKRKTGNRTAILAIVRHRGQTSKIGTGFSVEPQFWNVHRETVHVPGQPELTATTNRKLSELRDKILAFIAAHDRLPAPADLFPKKKAETTVCAEIENHIADIGKKVVPNSLKAYRTLKTHVAAFGDRSPEHFPFPDFQSFLQKKGLADGTVFKMVKTLKTVLKNQDFKIPTPKYRDQIWLDKAEIQKLADFDFSKNPAIDNARNLLLVECFTGQRFSDLPKILAANHQKPFVEITQQKTGQRVTIPISEKLALVLAKNPRPISNQKMNNYIKTALRSASFVEKITVTKFFEKKGLSDVYEKWELANTHTGRRSFATNAVLDGLPIQVVMKFTGHKSEIEFLKYIRASGIEVAARFANHPFFK